jgi:hypothetical protein
VEEIPAEIRNRRDDLGQMFGVSLALSEDAQTG